jgi:hypothetical protein
MQKKEKSIPVPVVKMLPYGAPFFSVSPFISKGNKQTKRNLSLILLSTKELVAIALAAPSSPFLPTGVPSA